MATVHGPIAAHFPEFPASHFNHNFTKHIRQDFMGGKNSTNVAGAINFLNTAVYKPNVLANRNVRDFMVTFFAELENQMLVPQSAPHRPKFYELKQIFTTLTQSYDAEQASAAARQVAAVATADAEAAVVRAAKAEQTLKDAEN